MYDAPVTLVELAQLSDIAYLDGEEAVDAAAALGFTTVHAWNVMPAQAYLWTREGVAVLAYRGTEASSLNIRDLVSNSRFGPNPWQGPGEANAGYARQFHAILSVSRKIIRSVSSDTPLIITGHSMGGAIATLAAAWLSAQGWKATALVPFGSPKALTEDGLSRINMEVVRVTNRRDFAPHWPVFTNKSHPKGQFKVDSGGPGAWPLSVIRHKPANYIKALQRAA